MSKRNRIASLLMLPFAVVIWAIGWVMCLIGEKKVTRQNKGPDSVFCSSKKLYHDKGALGEFKTKSQ